jgi:hypothetical protein
VSEAQTQADRDKVEILAVLLEAHAARVDEEDVPAVRAQQAKPQQHTRRRFYLV